MMKAAAKVKAVMRKVVVQHAVVNIVRFLSSVRDECGVDKKLQPGGSNFLDTVVHFELRGCAELIDFEIVQGGLLEAECNLTDAIGVGVRVCVVIAHES